jgi:hypothetical protein
MFHFFAARSFIAVAVAAIVASQVALLTAIAPSGKATATVHALYQLPAKGDRMPSILKGAACSSLGWPHYEPSCLYDFRTSSDDVRTVRIIALRSR